jgi:hypothetical protein
MEERMEWGCHLDATVITYDRIDQSGGNTTWNIATTVRSGGLFTADICVMIPKPSCPSLPISLSDIKLPVPGNSSAHVALECCLLR